MPDVASGWGRLTYGQANWGDAVTIKQGWGRLGWGAQAYGDSPTVTLSGLSATTSVGTPEVEVRPGWGTLNWGENGWGSVDEAIETLTGIGATSSVGSVITEIAIDLTGVSATASCPTQLDIPQLISGVSATVSEGQLNISATTNVGAIAPTEMTVGLTGQEATASVGSFSIIALGDIDISGNTSYNGVDVTGNTSYTDVEHVA
jgi:hypothetical protein